MQNFESKNWLIGSVHYFNPHIVHSKTKLHHDAMWLDKSVFGRYHELVNVPYLFANSKIQNSA